MSAAGRPEPADSYRILLVEDDAGDALLVEEILADTTLSVTLRWTQTFADALAALAEQVADCVLLDLHLPDASGIEAVKDIQRACPSAAIIVLTGLSEDGTGALAVAAGAQDYLVKGHVEPQLLSRSLRYAVHRKQAEQTAAELRENHIRAQENTRLERGLLPAPLLTAGGITPTLRYLPGRHRALLGGDFLDVVQTRDGLVHAVIGDVSGHGPDEAALGVCLRIAWRSLTLAGHRGAELLDLMEQVLVAERIRAEMFATCAFLCFDLAAGSATILLAGHPEPLFTDTAGTRPVEAAHGIALGIVPGLQGWPTTSIELPRTGALMLFTDGLIEGHAGPGTDRLNTDGLLHLIATAPGRGPEELLDHLISTTRELDAGRHSDDLAILHLTWDLTPAGPTGGAGPART